MPLVRSMKIRLRVSSWSHVVDGSCGKPLTKLRTLSTQRVVHVVQHAADARVAGVEPLARSVLDDVVDQLPLLKPYRNAVNAPRSSAGVPTFSRWSCSRISSARIVRRYLQRGVNSMPSSFSTA